ncbi:hypothetical protein AO371_0548 [Moraxella catarrhalis]|nr:hypothetical protein AO378_0052 [Moraxella catarrhalis]OAV12278.1 hypothetical protein AO380_0419 [Moraxella catarrhalis]OAV25753.1 hypothetical protein AO371_0548 [Moraxella catarrhalis]OAV30118.1 hypothetical protein AO367_1350 [Moraxella catarrhalis]
MADIAQILYKIWANVLKITAWKKQNLISFNTKSKYQKRYL